MIIDYFITLQKSRSFTFTKKQASYVDSIVTRRSSKEGVSKLDHFQKLNSVGVVLV